MPNLAWQPQPDIRIDYYQLSKYSLIKSVQFCTKTESRDHIFSCVGPFYDQVVSDLDRSMHRSQWALVAHSSFIDGSHTAKNMASEFFFVIDSFLIDASEQF
jgi:hypothetical protein